MLIALDRTGEWFRYHHLFHDLLRAELQRREPERVAALHIRAADWYEENALPELAIHHAQAAGDADRVNSLCLVNAPAAYAQGRIHSVERWMAWFDDRGIIEDYPLLAVLGAVMFSVTGRVGEAERWADAAEQSPRASLDSILPDGSTLAGWFAALRLAFGRDGLDGMRRDADLALSGLGARSGYRAAVLIYEAVCYLYDGDADRADAMLAHAIDVASDAGRPPAVLFAVATRGFIASDRNEWSAAETFAKNAVDIIETWGLGDNAESALAFALAARTACHAHDLAVRAATSWREPCDSGLCSPSHAHLHPCRHWSSSPATTPTSTTPPAPARSSARRERYCASDPISVSSRTRSTRSTHARRNDAHRQDRRLLAHLRGTASRPAPPDPSDVPEDRRAPPDLPPYGKDPSDVDLPKARRLVARRGDQTASGARLGRRVSVTPRVYLPRRHTERDDVSDHALKICPVETTPPRPDRQIMQRMAATEAREPDTGNWLGQQARVTSVAITEICIRYAEQARFGRVTLQELCQVSGVSERRLRDAFYDCYGESPTVHLRMLALHEVRRALRGVRRRGMR